VLTAANEITETSLKDHGSAWAAGDCESPSVKRVFAAQYSSPSRPTLRFSKAPPKMDELPTLSELRDTRAIQQELLESFGLPDLLNQVVSVTQTT
jgi:hypothetical protein